MRKAIKTNPVLNTKRSLNIAGLNGIRSKSESSAGIICFSCPHFFSQCFVKWKSSTEQRLADKEKEKVTCLTLRQFFSSLGSQKGRERIAIS